MSDWFEIVERYGGVVWRSAYRLLGSQKDAAECFCETFVSAGEVLEDRRVRNLSVLLVRVVTAKSIERLRGRFHRGGSSHAVDLVYVPADESGGGEQIQTRELVGQLQKALCRLGHQEAEIFCLHKLNDFTCKQIGRELGINVKTARILLQRAVRKLSEHLGLLKDQGAAGESIRILDEAVSTLRSELIAPGPGEQVVREVLSKLPGGGETGEAAVVGKRSRIAGRVRIAQRVTIAAAGAAIIAAVLVGIKLFTDSAKEPDVAPLQRIVDTVTPEIVVEEHKQLWDELDGELEAELQQIRQMYAAGDVDGLIRMLMESAAVSKLFAARYLGEIGDEKALGVLQALYLLSQKSLPDGYGQSLFAEAIEKITARLEEQRQAQADAEPNAEPDTEGGNVYRGFARDAAGDPILGVSIRSVLCVRKNRYSWSLEPKQDDKKTTTDGDGFFEMEASGAGNEKIRSILVFDHPEYGVGWMDADLAARKDDWRMRLFEPTVIGGSVVDDEGAGIEGAVISIEPNSPSYRLVEGFSIAVGTTDTDGGFLIERIGDLAKVHINVTRDGYAPYTTRGQGEFSGGVAAGREDLEVTLLAGGLIRGRLVSGGEEYHKEGIVVRAYGPDSDRLVKTDENGQFEIPGLSSGSYTLSAHDPSIFKISSGGTDLLGSSLVTVEVEASSPSQVELELQSGLWVTLRITDRDSGEPVSNYPFRISPQLGKGGQGDATQDITDAEGQFAAALVPGDYVARAESWEQGKYTEVTQDFSVVGSEEDLNVEVEVASRPKVHGKILDGDGLPVSGYLWFASQRLDSDEQGRFEVPEPEGPYPKTRTCFAFDDGEKLGKAWYWHKDAAGGSQEDVEIVLEPLASIVGRAVDADGAGVGDAEIGVFVRQGSSGGAGGTAFAEGKYAGKHIDAEGWFRIEGVAVGLQTLLQVGKTETGVGGRDLGQLEGGQVVDVGEIVLSALPISNEEGLR